MPAKHPDDFAVVAGINRYPSLGNLGGPENDAIAFRDWLIAPDGGGLDENNVTLIISSNFQPIGDPLLAQPGISDIHVPLTRLQQRGIQNGWRLGRRLYLFFAGHGFAPTSAQSDTRDPVLLTADAGQTNLSHVPAVKYANWFRDAGMFNEIVLFVDCCRRNNVSVHPASLLWPITSGKSASKHTFYAIATRPGEEARERDFDGVRRGVFSKTLIDGLRGAVDPKAEGPITGTRLADFLHKQVPIVGSAGQSDITGDDLDPEVRFDPSFDVDFDPRPGPRPNTTPVRIALAGDNSGQRVQLLDGAHNIVATADPALTPWRLDLSPGFYKLQGPSRSMLFEVTTPTGEVLDVSF